MKGRSKGKGRSGRGSGKGAASSSGRKRKREAEEDDERPGKEASDAVKMEDEEDLEEEEAQVYNCQFRQLRQFRCGGPTAKSFSR